MDKASNYVFNPEEVVILDDEVWGFERGVREVIYRKEWNSQPSTRKGLQLSHARDESTGGLSRRLS